MKKLLGLTLTLAMIAPAGANAELLKNLKATGQIDIQATSADNVLDFAGQATAPSNPAGNNNINANQSSISLRALVASFKGNDMASGSAYVYNQERRTTGQLGNANNNGKNDILWVFGVKGKATMGGLTAGAELAKNLGQNRTGGSNPGDQSSYTG